MFTSLPVNIYVQPYIDAFRDAYNPLSEEIINFSHATIYSKLANVNPTDVSGLAGMVVGISDAGEFVPANSAESLAEVGILFMDAAGIPYSNLSNAQVGKGAVMRGMPLLGVKRYQTADTAGTGTLTYAPGDILVTGADTSYLKKKEAETTKEMGVVRAVLEDGTLVVQLYI